MTEFDFDIQRFDDEKVVEVSTAADLRTAIENLDTTPTTIKLTADITNPANIVFGQYSNRTVTLDLNGYKITYGSSYSRTINVYSNADVTIKGGTIIFDDATSASIINRGGTLTLENMTLDGIPVTTTVNNGTVTATSTTVSLQYDQSFAVRTTSDTAYATYTVGSGASNRLTLIYDSDGATSVKGLDAGRSFTRTSGDETVEYTITTAGLRAVSDGITKVYRGDKTISQTVEIPMSELLFTGESTALAQGILMNSGNANFTFSADTTGNLTAGADAVPIISYSDYSKNFGTIKKNDDGSFSLTKETSDATSWTNVTIGDGSTVDFTADFRGMEIVISGTTFTTADSQAFTVSSGDYVSITGSNNVSLGAGTIQTATQSQTITAGNYSVDGYTGGTDGINVIASTTATLISDIDDGESFNVDGTTYTKREFGLTTSDGTNINALYTGDGFDTIKSGVATTIDLSKLAAGMRKFIAPSASAITLGGANNYSAVVLNTTENISDGSNVTKYAELTVSDDKKSYVLDTITTEGKVAFRNAVDTIFVDGVYATIDADLIGAKDADTSGKKMKIVTLNGTKFIVTECDNDTFSVNGGTDAPQIIGAKKITLLEGSLTTYRTTNTTITIGENGPTLAQFTSGMTVTLRDDEITIKGKANDSFVFNDESYKINGSVDGMTFTFDTTGQNLIFKDLSVTDNDGFTYGGRDYTVASAGFIRDGDSMWTGGISARPHALSGATVSVDDLNNTDNWGAIATVNTTYNSVSLPSVTDTITLVGGDFNNIYGVFSGSSGAYFLDTLESTAQLQSATVSGMKSLSATAGFKNLTVTAPVATFAVTDYNANDDGWNIQLTGDAASAITKGESITLLNGRFQVDSDTNVALATAGSIVTAGASTTITVGNDGTGGTITGLDPTEIFHIDGLGDYTQGIVGLTKDSKYLFGSKDGTALFRDITLTSAWGDLISANELTITADATNALIVNDSASATTLYADLIANTTGITLSKATGGANWKDSNAIIYIDNATVNVSSDFAGIVDPATIVGIQSEATINVTEANNFTFNDAGAGAVIGNVNAYSLTGGRVSLTTGQTVSADAGNLSADGGNGIMYYVGGNTASDATIAALDTNDTISVKDSVYAVWDVGIMTDDDKLLTSLTSKTSVTVADLENSEKINTVMFGTDSVLAIAPTVAAGTSYPLIVIDQARANRYGTIATVSGGYSIYKDDADSAWNSAYTIGIDNQHVTLTTDFLGVNLRGEKSGAEFKVTNVTVGAEDFSVYDVATGATLSPEISTITQTAGLIAPKKDQTIVVGSNRITATDDDIAVSVNSDAATITGIDSGEVFKINELSYSLLTNGRFLRLSDSKVYNGDAVATSDAAVAVNSLINADNWNSWYAITTTDTGDLVIDDEAVEQLTTGTAAFVVGSASYDTIEGATVPTDIFGTLTYTGSVYSLTTDGKSSGKNLTSVVVTNKTLPVTFSTDFISQGIPIFAGESTSSTVTAFTVTAGASFTVNYSSDKVSVDAAATAIDLTGGTLYISDSAQTISGGKIKVVAGGTAPELTVNYSADDSIVKVGEFDTAGESVTISSTNYGLIAGDGFDIIIGGSSTTLNGVTVSDAFYVGSTSYIMTSIGLATNDKTKLNTAVGATDTQFTTDKLGATHWETVYQADDGALSITTSTPTEARIVDLNDPANSSTYGKLTYSGGVYGLSLAEGDLVPTSISLSSGVMASLPADCANLSITALGATFTATSESAFTVDARSTYAIVSSPIELSAGTVQAVLGATVTVQGKAITATNDTKTAMTVGINSSNKAYISGLDEGDTFTIGGASYEMTRTGLRKGDQIVYNNSGTFIIDDESATNILSVVDTNLDLRGKTENALVYNQAVTTQIGTLSVGSEMVLSGLSTAPDNIKSVDIDPSTVFKVDFTTKVNAPSGGIVTVNDNMYTGAGSIVISATADDSSLYSGTVALASDDSVKASNGTLTVVAGSVSATAALGNLTTIDGLDTGESFTFGGSTYTQTAAGLMLGNTICEALSGTSISIGGLTSGKFVNVLAPTNGELNLSTVTSDANVYDSATTPTTRLAALTISGTRYTLKDGGSASSAIDTVDIKASSTLVTDFATQVISPTGTVTVNGKTYVGTTALTLDATATTSTLNEGTVTLTATSTATNSATADVALKATSGAINATASNGAWTELGGLASDESFTLDGTTYTQKGAGLTKGGTSICEDLAGATVFIDDLNSATWTRYVTTNSSGVLSLADVTATANVYNNAVTSRLGTVTKNKTVYTLDYAGQVSSAAGSTVTVNGKAYTGTTALTIATTVTGSTQDSTLYAGTVSIGSGKSVTANETINVTSGTLTATASGGSWTTLGGLSDGTTFTIDGTTYQVNGTDTLVELVDGTLAKLYTNYISNGTIAYSELTDSNFYAIYELDSDNVLDLTEKSLSTEQTIVVGHSAPTTRVAGLSYSATTGYTLSPRSDGVLTNFAGVKLGSKARVLTTTLETTVTTTDTTTYTVNGDYFNAQGALSLATSDGSATLIDGTVSLVTGKNWDDVTVTGDVDIAATTGTVTVDVDGSTVTVGALNNADAFTVSSASYLKTSIGLATGDKTKLNTSIGTSVTTDNLSGSAWQTVLPVDDDGTLTITASTAADVLVVDLNDPTSSYTYGKLTKDSGTYSLDTTGTSTPDAVSVTGTKITLPVNCKEATITAGGATFTVTATDAFTIDASSSTPAVIGVTGVYLTAGTLAAPANIPVSVNGKSITATNSSEMTIGVSDGKTFVGELNVGDTFTIGGASYEMTRAGLRKNGDKIVYANTDTFWLDDEASANILAVKGTNLDLTEQTDDAVVYNEAITTRLGTLSVGSEMTLSGLSNAPANIKTIDVATNTVLNVDFVTKVNAPSGLVTVNDNVYTGTGDIVISATADDSSLYSGTVALASDDSVQASNGTAQVVDGSINVTAALGRITEFNDVNTGESFTFGGNSYVQSAVGLMKNGDTICESLNGDFTVNSLTNGKFVDILTPTTGELDIDSQTANANVYDNAADPAVKYATLTVSGNRYVLNDSGSAADAINLVDVASGATFTVDFETQVSSPGSVTVNGNKYTASNTIVLDATADGSTLNEGTVTLNTSTPSASATHNGTLTVNNGTIDATATLGYFTALSELDTGDSFTFNYIAYTQTDVGLKFDSYIAEALSGSEIALDDLETVAWNAFLTTDSNGVLTLADMETEDANVYNYDMTERLGTVTKSDNVYTVDYAGQVRAAAGSLSVNGVAYTALNTVIIDTTADSSTLTNGTVNLDSGDAVTTTSEHTINNTAGDGLTVNASGSAVTFGALNSGDAFTADDTDYQVTDAALFNTTDENIYTANSSTTTTLDKLTGDDDWNNYITVSNGALNITSGFLPTADADADIYFDDDSDESDASDSSDASDASDGSDAASDGSDAASDESDAASDESDESEESDATSDGSDATVDSDAVIVSDDLSKVFGTLLNESGTYRFTANNLVNGALSTISVVDTAATFDADFADVDTFTANDATVTDVTINTRSKTFTVDATNETPRFSDDVKSLTLTAGEIYAVAGQAVTAGDHVLTPTNVSDDAIISLEDISGLSVGDTFVLDGDTYTYVDELGLFNTTDNALVTNGFNNGTLTFECDEEFVIAPVNGIVRLSDVEHDKVLVVDSLTNPTTQLGTLTRNGTAYTIDYATQVSSPSGTVTLNGVTYTGTTTLLLDATATSSTLTTGTVSLASGDNVNTTSEHKVAATAGDGLTVNASGSAVTFGLLNSGDAFTTDNTNYQITDAALFNTTDENIYTANSPTTITLEKLTGDDDWNNYVIAASDTLNIADGLLTTGDDAIAVSDDLAKVFGTLTNDNDTYQFTANNLVNGALSSISVVDTAATFDADFADVDTFTANDATVSDVAINTRSKTFTVDATNEIPRFSSDVKSLTLTAGEVYAVAGQAVTAGDHILTPINVADDAIISLEDISGLSVGDTFALDGDTYTYVDKLGLFNTTDNALVTDGFSDGTLTFDRDEEFVIAPVNGIVRLSDVEYDKVVIVDSLTNPTTQLGTLTRNGTAYTIDYATQVSSPSGTVTLNGVTYTGTTTLLLDATATTSTLTNGTVSLASGDNVNTTSEHTINATAGDGLTVNAAGSAVTFGLLNSGDAFTTDNTNYQITDAALFNTTDENIYTANSPTTITLDKLTGDDDWNNYVIAANDALNIADGLLTTGDDAVAVSDDLAKVFGTLLNDDDTYRFTANNLVNGALSSISVVDTTATFDADFADVDTFTANDTTVSDVTINTRSKTFTVDATNEIPRFSADVKALTLTAGEIYAVAGQAVTAGDHVLTPTNVSDDAIISLEDISGLSVGDTFVLDGDTYTYVDKLGLFNTTDNALVTDGFNDGTLTFERDEEFVIAPVNGIVRLSDVAHDKVLVVDSLTNPTTQLGTLTRSGTAYTIDYATQVSSPSGTVTLNGVTYTGTTTLLLDATATTSTLTNGTVSLDSGDNVNTTSEHKVAATAGDGLTVNASGSAVTFGLLNSGDAFTTDNTNYQITDAALFNTTDENIYTANSPTTITLEKLTGDDDWNNYVIAASDALNIADGLLTTGDDAIAVSDDLAKVFGTLTNDNDTYQFTANNLVNGALSSISVVDTTATFDADFADVDTFTANDATVADVTINTRSKTFTVDATNETPRFSDDVKALTLTAGEVYAVAGQAVTADDHVLTPINVADDAIISLEDISGLEVGDTFALDGDTYTYVDKLGLFNTTDNALVTDGFNNGTLTFERDEEFVIAPVNGIVRLSDVAHDKVLVVDSLTNPTTQLGTLTRSGTTYTIDYATQVSAPSGTVTLNGVTYTGTTTLLLDATATTSTLTNGTVSLDSGDNVNTTSEHTINATAGDGLTVNAAGSAVTFGLLNSGDAFTTDNTNYQITDAALFNTTDENIYTANSPTTITLDKLTGDDDWNNYVIAANDALNIADGLLTTGDDAIAVSDDLAKVFGTLTNDNDTYQFTANNLVNGALSSISVVDTAAIFDADFADVETFTANDAIVSDVTINTRSKTFTVDATNEIPRFSSDVKSLTLTAGEIYAVAGQAVTAGEHVLTPMNVSDDAIISLEDISGLEVGDTFALDGDTYTYVDKLGLFNTTDNALVTDGFSDGTLTFERDEEFVIAPVNGIVRLSDVEYDKVVIVDSLTNPTTQLGTLTRNGTAYTIDYATQVSSPSGTVTLNGVTYTGTTTLLLDATATSSTLTNGTVSLDSGDNVATTSEHTINATAGDGLTVNASGSAVTFGLLNSGDAFTTDNTNYQITDAALFNTTDENIYTAASPTTITLEKLTGDDDWNNYVIAANDALNIADGLLTTGDDAIAVSDDLAKVFGTLTNDDDTYQFTANNLVNGALSSISVVDTAATFDADFADVDTFTANDATVSDVAINTRSKTFMVDATNETPRFSDDVKALTLTAGEVYAVAGQAVTADDHVLTPINVADDAIISLEDISGLEVGDTFALDGDTYTYVDKLGLFNTTDNALVTDGFNNGTLTFERDEEFVIAPVNGIVRLSDVEHDKVLVVDSLTNPTTQLGTLTRNGTAYTIDYATQVSSSAGTVTLNGVTYTGTTTLLLDATATTSTLTNGTVSLDSGDNVNTTSEHTINATAGDGLTVNAAGSAVTFGLLNSGDAFIADNTNYQITDAALFNTTDENIYTANSPTTITLEKLTGDDDWNNYVTISNGTLNITEDILPTTDADIYFDDDSDESEASSDESEATSDESEAASDESEATSDESEATSDESDASDESEAASDESEATVVNDAIIVSDDLTKVYGTLTKENGTYRFTSNDLVNDALSAINIDEATTTFDAEFAEINDFTANGSTFSDLTLNARSKTFTITATDEIPRFSDDVKSLTLTAGTVYAVAGQAVTADEHVITPTTVSDNVSISLEDISGLSAGDTFSLDEDTYTYVENVGLFNTKNNALVTDGFNDGTLTFERDEEFVIAPVNGVVQLSDVEYDKVVIVDNVTNPTEKLGTLTRSDTIYTIDGEVQVGAPSGTLTLNGVTYNGITTLILTTTPDSSTLTEGTVSLDIGDNVATTSEDTITNTAGDGLTVNAADSAVTIDGINSGDAFTVNGNTYTVKDAGPMTSAGALWRGDDYSDGVTVDELETEDNWMEPIAVANKGLPVDAGTLLDGEEVLLTDSTTAPTETYGVLSKDSDGKYTLTVSDGDTLLSTLTVSGVIIDVDNDLASDDVAITTINADDTETKFTVNPKRGTEYFTVDATGNIPNISDAGSIELISGKLSPGDDIPVKPTEDVSDATVVIGNGTHKIGDKTVTLENQDGTTEVTLDDDGNISKINPLDNGATVTVDGTTYTSTADGSTLNYTADDGWYFDDYVPASGMYTITVDRNGNITVDTGAKFSDVVSSGRTLPTDATIKLAADIDATPITLINNGTTAVNLTDADGNSLVENLGKISGVLFDGDGVEFDSLSDARGATFSLDDEQSLTAGTTVINANDDGVEVTIGRRDRLSVEGDISAVNATIDLSTSDAIKYDGMSLSGAGTAIFDGEGDLTITDGTTATSAAGKSFTIYGTVFVDGKTVNAATSASLTATANDFTVGDTALTVTGDDVYTVNIDANSSITSVENLGSETGVTVGGLSNGTLFTDAAGSLTVDKTFASGASVTYTVTDGKISAADGVTTISGDFANGVAVNETPYTISGGTVTIDASTGNVAANAGSYTVNGKTYTTSTPTTFSLSGGTVTGADMDGVGNFAIHQDETGFAIDDDTLNLSGNSVVTLGLSGDSVNTADGVEGIISGLGTATVNDIGDATINGTAINVAGDEVTALVTDGTVTALTDADDGSTITSAPSMTITAGNGSYTFPNGDWTINDTVDSSVNFLTDGNSNVIDIADLAGSINGSLEEVTLNGSAFSTTGDSVTVAADGTNITGVYGLSSGDSVGGSLSMVTFDMPEGSLTVNGAAFTLSGDDGIQLADDTKTITGMDTGAVLTVGAAGEYAINDTNVTAAAGDVFGINRDGLYKADADNMPITERTPYADILSLGASSTYIEESASGTQSATLGNRDEIALIDSANAPTNITTGTGNDSVVVRHGAQATVDTANGDNTLVVTKGKVTLENYSASNANVQTFDYSNIPAAVKNNSIKFGDGVMTLGDGVITFDATASVNGATLTEIVDARGNTNNVGFTHTGGGTINTTAESANYLLKGNYADGSTDTQKSAGSSLISGGGNDTLLIGANDFANAGGGTNQIYITDPSLRSAAATIVLSDGTTNVHKFNGGFNATNDVIQVRDMSALEFGAGTEGFTMTSGDAQMNFSDITPAELVSVSSATGSMNAAGGYELKLQNGNRTYNVAVAQDGRALAVTDAADIYYGNSNGLSFTEYTGTVSVNLANGTGSIGGTASTIYGGATKLAAGSGNTTLTGSSGNETLFGGTGNTTINSGAGADLMVGNTSSLKSGSTKFIYTSGNGLDTIRNMDFVANAGDGVSDEVLIDVNRNVISSVNVNGSNVSIGLNGAAGDYLTLANARGQHFKINDLVAKVDSVMAYDGYTSCYVGVGNRPTVSVGANMGDVAIWLSENQTTYLGDIAVLNASAATGNNTLVGNDVNNLIVGGTGKNSIWGGEFATDDTLVGGKGQNTFFFQDNNGTDLIRNTHDGDVVELVTATLDKISSTAITGNGLSIDFKDGSRLSVEGSANVEYKLADGTSYTADHSAREWRQK